jgi:hypothetical protein
MDRHWRSPTRHFPDGPSVKVARPSVEKDAKAKNAVFNYSRIGQNSIRWTDFGRGCVKTSARFRTSLFRSLLRGLRAFRVEKIAKNLALLDRLNFAEFLHGLDPESTNSASHLRSASRTISGHSLTTLAEGAKSPKADESRDVTEGVFCGPCF